MQDLCNYKDSKMTLVLSFETSGYQLSQNKNLTKQNNNFSKIKTYMEYSIASIAESAGRKSSTATFLFSFFLSVISDR